MFGANGSEIVGSALGRLLGSTLGKVEGIALGSMEGVELGLYEGLGDGLVVVGTRVSESGGLAPGDAGSKRSNSVSSR